MSQSQAAPPKWWLLLEGATAGPFTHAQVAAQIASGQLSLQTLASPVGTTQWRPLQDWNCFEAPGNDFVFRSAPRGPQEIDTSAAAKTSAFPNMVHWLVNYGLFVSPVLWLIGQASSLASQPMFADHSPLQSAEALMGCFSFLVSSTATALLFAGALYLKKRRRAGARLMVAGFSLDMAHVALSLFAFASLMAAAAQEPGNPQVVQNDAPPTPGELVLCVIPMASGVFELVGLVWLLSHAKSLPLR